MKRLANNILLAITIITIVTEVCGTVTLSFLKDTDRIYYYWLLFVFPFLVIAILFCRLSKTLEILKGGLNTKSKRKEQEAQNKIEIENIKINLEILKNDSKNISTEVLNNVSKKLLTEKRIEPSENELEGVFNDVTEMQKETSNKIIGMLTRILNGHRKTTQRWVKRKSHLNPEHG